MPKQLEKLRLRCGIVQWGKEMKPQYLDDLVGQTVVIVVGSVRQQEWCEVKGVLEKNAENYSVQLRDRSKYASAVFSAEQVVEKDEDANGVVLLVVVY